MHTKMGSDHNLHGVCNTGLELGLGSHDHRTTLGDEHPDLDHHRRHHQESKKKPIMMSLKYDHLLPSDLTLGPIASSSDHDVHDHHQANQSSPVSTENTILHQRASSLSAVSSFSNSSASTTVVKRDREVISGEDDAETNLETSLVSPRVISDNYINNQLEDDQDQGSPRKKLRLTKQQSALLEDSFKEHTTLNPKQKQDLARQLNLRPRQVEVWFQNRRARTKLKQTEADYEQWKKCCETLTEENKRLQKELQELKSLKLITAPFYMPFPAPPPATLTICPSCERIGGGVGGGGDSTTRFLIRPKPAHLISNPHPSEAAC